MRMQVWIFPNILQDIPTPHWTLTPGSSKHPHVGPDVEANNQLPLKPEMTVPALDTQPECAEQGNKTAQESRTLCLGFVKAVINLKGFRETLIAGISLERQSGTHRLL